MSEMVSEENLKNNAEGDFLKTLANTIEGKLDSKYFLGSVGLHILFAIALFGTAYLKNTQTIIPLIDVDVVDIEFTEADQNIEPVLSPRLRQKAIPQQKKVVAIPQEQPLLQHDGDDILKEKTKETVNEQVTPQVAQEGDGTDDRNSEGSEGGSLVKNIKMSYDQYLVAYIRKYKTYPRIAERLKQQGTVFTKIIIGNDGSLKDVLVAQSSGFKALDQGAINLIKSIAPFKPLPKHLKEQHEVNIPIEYILMGH